MMRVPNLVVIQGEVLYRYVDGKFTGEKVVFNLSLGNKLKIKEDLEYFRLYGFPEDVDEHQ